MRLALAEAAEAASGLTASGLAVAGPGEKGPIWPEDVPVGAVILDEAGTVIARARNRREIDHDPTAHAEIVALRAAARALGNYRLPDVTLYSTVEPCAMCCGALVHARIARLVYGAADPKAGAVESLFRLLEDARLNHHVAVTAGVRAAECGRRLSEFFRTRRG